MAASRSSERSEEAGRYSRPERDGRYLVITVVALVLAVYLALQIIGLVVKLLFVLSALWIGLVAWRVWRASS
jgi:hypothetical protein